MSTLPLVIVGCCVAGDGELMGDVSLAGEDKIFGDCDFAGDVSLACGNKIFGDCDFAGDVGLVGGDKIFGDCDVAGDGELSGAVTLAGEDRVSDCVDGKLAGDEDSRKRAEFTSYLVFLDTQVDAFVLSPNFFKATRNVVLGTFFNRLAVLTATPCIPHRNEIDSFLERFIVLGPNIVPGTLKKFKGVQKSTKQKKN